MNEYQVDKSLLITESDVEQKILFPLLNNKEPIGLGYNYTEIQTKVNLQKLLIDKGVKSILYYPDYLITVNGIPSLIVEAKKPDEDLDEAFRQASLYAGELNRKFRNEINPCQLIIASDGVFLFASHWDDAAPTFKIETTHWLYAEKDFNEFVNKFSKTSVDKKASEIKSSIRKNIAYKRPLNLIGGTFIQNKASQNTFGETISIQYRHLFNPNEEEEKVDIVRNAYVKVYKHESHINPINKLIRKKILPSFAEANEIDDNTEPKEIIEKLKNASNYNNHVLLLVGSVGSGKSTFSTYLKEVALPIDLMSSLVWLTLDLNNAPVAVSEIYIWIKKSVIAQIQHENKNINFDSLEGIQRLYSTEINKLKNGVLQLLNPESDRYRELLVEKIIHFQNDLDVTLNAYIEQFIFQHKKNLIITLDNSDKRNLEEQLLMFEVANWIKDSIKAIVFLPIRDTTFDHFRKQKPLDTVVKDLIFRITPPSLEKVLYNRISYATRLSKKSGDRFYYLPNSIKVSYPAQDEIYYLKGILTSLFQNTFFKRLILGLAGSDIRVGLEIFLDFCKSGHISDQEILKMKQTRGESRLPNHLISKVFLRGNKVYYNDNSAKIKNIFFCEPTDNLPDPFVRVSILRWLNEKYRTKGPSGITGFHLAETIINELVSLGHDSNRIADEMVLLLRQTLILSESQRTNTIDYKELLSINTSGIVHLELIANIDYLAACSEDMWYNVVEVATKISKSLVGEGNYVHLSSQNIYENAKLLVDYLEDYYNKHYKGYSEFIAEGRFFNPVDFNYLKSKLENFKNGIPKNKFHQFEKGNIINARIINIKEYGLIVEMPNSDKIGIIHKSQIKERDFENVYSVEENVEVEVVRFNDMHYKYDLKLMRSLDK